MGIVSTATLDTGSRDTPRSACWPPGSRSSTSFTGTACSAWEPADLRPRHSARATGRVYQHASARCRCRRWRCADGPAAISRANWPWWAMNGADDQGDYFTFASGPYPQASCSSGLILVHRYSRTPYSDADGHHGQRRVHPLQPLSAFGAG